MNDKEARMVLIKAPYWLGIGADALWAVALFVPAVYGALTGNSDFNPDLQHRLTMGLGGTMMTGWTLLLMWAVREPVERRFVILLTAFPVVFGLFIVALVGFLAGNTFELWILIKSAVLFSTMIMSYVMARRISKEGV